MKKAAGLCRPLYPFCKREVQGNVLQYLQGKAEQAHNLQCSTVCPEPYAQHPASA